MFKVKSEALGDSKVVPGFIIPQVSGGIMPSFDETLYLE